MDALSAGKCTDGKALGCSDGDIVIAIMSVTGSGKSTFISLLSDSFVEVGHGLESCTTDVTIFSYLLGTQNVILIDTPGFDDTNRSDTDVLKDIAFFLATIYGKVKLAGLIYLHRITDPRMAGSSLKNLHMFEKLCGEASFSNIILATTMWGNLASIEEGERREAELKDKDQFWGYMNKQGSQVVRHTGSAASAEEIVSMLVAKESTVTLDIQRQMVDENQTLDETAAGQMVQKELIEFRKKCERQIADIQESMEFALRKKDDDLVAEISEVQKANAANIARAEADSANLRISLRALIEEKDKQYSEALRKAEADRALHQKLLESKASEMNRLEDAMLKLRQDMEKQDQEHHEKIQALSRRNSPPIPSDNKRLLDLLEEETRLYKDQQAKMRVRMQELQAPWSQTKTQYDQHQDHLRADISLLDVLGKLSGSLGPAIQTFGKITGRPTVAAAGHAASVFSRMRSQQHEF